MYVSEKNDDLTALYVRKQTYIWSVLSNTKLWKNKPKIFYFQISEQNLNPVKELTFTRLYWFSLNLT